MSEQKPLDERPHQPTESKLSRIRTEGNVAKSEEFATCFRFFFMLLAIVMLWEQQVESLKSLFISHIDSINTLPSDQIFLHWNLILEASYPVFIVAAVGILASFVAKIIDIRGFVLNSQGMKPSFNQLNPVNGIKEVFSLDSLLKFISGFVKFTVITIAMLLIFHLHANSAIWSISCGIGCQIGFGFTILATITGLYMLLLAVSASVDMKVSRFLHRRKNRMSTQELRQEQRDNYGSPEMKGEQRNFRNELAGETPQQENQSNLVIHNGDVVHALHVYANGTAIILQTSDTEFLLSALAAGVYCVHDDVLTEQLSKHPHRKPLPMDVNGMIQKVIARL